VAQGYFCNPYVQCNHRQHGSHLQGLHARPILVTLDIHTSAVPRNRPLNRQAEDSCHWVGLGVE
jgi:hypothetical protein